MENGKRDEDLGSNPHSKGEFFSLSENVFFDVKFKIAIIIINNIMIIKVSEKIFKIIYTN